LLIPVLATLVATLSGCGRPLSRTPLQAESETVRRLVILYTNDEHGWMEPYKSAAGASGMMYLWKEREGYSPDGPFLVLSGGDMWTGPAISTLTAGESMTDVMNRMGYQAATLGNHDFDFDLDALRQRAAQADFPFLSANLTEHATGAPPEFVTPYTLIEVNGIQVGVIGVTTIETPVDTKPGFVQDLRLGSYADALERYVPELRTAGADLVVLAGHICGSEMRQLAPLAAELGVDVIGGGHCHEEIAEEISGLPLMQSTSYLMGYNRLELTVDLEADAVLDSQVEFVENRTRGRDVELERAIAAWRARLLPEVTAALGYARQPIDDDSPAMVELLLASWLRAIPQADVALASPRYVQQHIPAGMVSAETIIGVLPTTNELVQVELSGAALRQVIRARRPMVAGMRKIEEWVLEDGTPLQDDRTYTVLIPDTLYAGGNYYDLQQADSTPAWTGIDWRQPVIDWLRQNPTTLISPLDRLLGESIEPAD
jgi:2',3'-cyclic-nucleotide 2'-phosphodiesterase (5'-nucleotidase family)